MRSDALRQLHDRIIKYIGPSDVPAEISVSVDEIGYLTDSNKTPQN